MLDPHRIIMSGGLLVAFTEGDPEGIHFIGQVVSYMPTPTYQIQNVDEKISWSENLVREATDEEAIRYWKGRALLAEKKQ